MIDVSDDPVRVNVDCGQCGTSLSFMVSDQLPEPGHPLAKTVREKCPNCGNAIELDVSIGAIDPTAN